MTMISTSLRFRFTSGRHFDSKKKKKENAVLGWDPILIRTPVYRMGCML